MSPNISAPTCHASWHRQPTMAFQPSRDVSYRTEDITSAFKLRETMFTKQIRDVLRDIKKCKTLKYSFNILRVAAARSRYIVAGLKETVNSIFLHSKNRQLLLKLIKFAKSFYFNTVQAGREAVITQRK